MTTTAAPEPTSQNTEAVKHDPSKPLPGANPQQAVGMLVQQLNELLAQQGPATRAAIQAASQRHLTELVRVLEFHGYSFKPEAAG